MTDNHPLVFLAFAALFLILGIRFCQYIRELGCKPAPLRESKLYLGIPQVLAALKASREYTFPDFVVQRARDVGTGEISFLGQRRYFTRDPTNIKAILATQFKDFGLGIDRNKNLGALLGHGIVCFQLLRSCILWQRLS